MKAELEAKLAALEETEAKNHWQEAELEAAKEEAAANERLVMAAAAARRAQAEAKAASKIELQPMGWIDRVDRPR